MFLLCRFFSVDLPDNAKSAATRFRFWQPENQGYIYNFTYHYVCIIFTENALYSTISKLYTYVYLMCHHLKQKLRINYRG